MHAVQRELEQRLRFVFRHFPIEAIHPHARSHAAAEAAAAQGQLWAMHEHLFEHQQALADEDLPRYAVELGLDRDLASGEGSGHVGCCDSSPHKHTTQHYCQTREPLIRSFEPGEDRGRCDIDELYLEPAPPRAARRS